MDIKISIIVPVYNAEKYLRECIDSLLCQTLKEVEFIFVDDGSTDESLDLLNEYKSHDSRIHVISQENNNAGVARNKGMDAAKGKYLMFLDSDDYFKPNLLHEAFHTAESKQAQIVVFEYYSFNETSGKIEKRRSGHFPKEMFCIEDLGICAFQICKAMPWNKIFLRQFIVDNKIRFQSIKRCNDKVFVFTALSCAKKVFHLNKRLLYYRYNNPTSLQGTRNRSREDFINSLVALKKELKNRDLLSDKLREIFAEYACMELKTGMRAPFSVQSIKNFYQCAKINLIPNVFDSEAEFIHDKTLENLFNSNNFEEYIVEEYQSQLLTSISKESIEYKIGRAMMYIPRKIR